MDVSFSLCVLCVLSVFSVCSLCVFSLCCLCVLSVCSLCVLSVFSLCCRCFEVCLERRSNINALPVPLLGQVFFQLFSCFFCGCSSRGFSVRSFSEFLGFWVPLGGHGGALFQLWSVFSTKAGTFDFERQYNVLALFSKSGGCQKS